MTERPIIFSGESVRAVLEGRKTQTRRVVKYQGDMEFDPADPHFGPYWLSYADGENAKVRCPHGVPGDKLWVREAWELIDHEGDYRVQVAYPADDIGGLSAAVWATAPKWWIYARGVDAEGEPLRKHGTQSPLFMPRWASRITLEITDVRVQRVQEISEDDAVVEGVAVGQRSPIRASGNGTACITCGRRKDQHVGTANACPRGTGTCFNNLTYRGGFSLIWDSLNAKPKPFLCDGVIVGYQSFPWADGTRTETYRGKPHYIYGNPFVWSLTFRVLEGVKR
jgi:hypothetical protein